MRPVISPPATLLHDIGFCLAFFTRLPVPQMSAQGRNLGTAIWAAPIAGWMVALLGAAAFWFADTLGLAAGPAAALALTATAIATGCLHEDGLSDTADGFGGGRDRDRKLEIMRDSRIGTYGACALALSLLLRWTALSSTTEPALALAALGAAHASSRGLLPAFMRLTPAARAAGLASGAGAVGSIQMIAALVLGGLSLLVLGGSTAFVVVLLLGLLFFAFRALCLRQIGGHTGDTLGALQQAAEITVLLIASAMLFQPS